jgi:hypothetical protein
MLRRNCAMRFGRVARVLLSPPKSKLFCLDLFGPAWSGLDLFGRNSRVG